MWYRMRVSAPLARDLSRWFAREARELPWRETRDPYRIWVSEVMLQQTRVETVLAYYDPFVARFPSLADLAAAPLDAVLEQWSGLGYYRRARLLHRGAQYVAEQLGGRLPEAAQALQEIPGIGPYTAGALASIAFDRPEPLVDGNVARVRSRLCALEDPRQQPATAKGHWSWVRELLEAGEPRVLSQALMELGATVCTPRSPSCEACPVSRHCEARAIDAVERIPAPKVKKASPEFHFDAVALRWGERILLERRPDEGLLAGLWCLPLRATKSKRAPSAASLAKHFDVEPAAAKPRVLAPIKHVFTHRVWHLRPVELRLARRPKAGAQRAWIEAGERPEGGVPSVTNKLLAALGF